MILYNRRNMCGVFAIKRALLTTARIVFHIIRADAARKQAWTSEVNTLTKRSQYASCTLVMLRYIENIEISIRYRYIVSYRIARGNIEIFDIPVSTF